MTFGRWLIAGTPTHKPYPCRCSVKRRCQAAPLAFCCPCINRTDTDHLPSHCCAKRAADTKERTAAA